MYFYAYTFAVNNIYIYMHVWNHFYSKFCESAKVLEG